MHLDINRVGVTQIFNVMKKIKLSKRTVANLSASEMMGVHGASVAEGDCMGSYNCSERVCVCQTTVRQADVRRIRKGQTLHVH